MSQHYYTVPRTLLSARGDPGLGDRISLQAIHGDILIRIFGTALIGRIGEGFDEI